MREWFIRKSGLFYRPGRSGYTVDPVAAGLYTEDEARAEALIEKTISAHHASEFADHIRQARADVAMIWNCRVIELNDEPKTLPFRQVKALDYVNAARIYCETDAWYDVSWDDGDEAVIEIGEDGFLGEPKRVRVNVIASMALHFCAADDTE